MKNLSCASPPLPFSVAAAEVLRPSPMGLIYASVSDPVASTCSFGSHTGAATSYLGLVTGGDSSISSAKV